MNSQHCWSNDNGQVFGSGVLISITISTTFGPVMVVIGWILLAVVWRCIFSICQHCWTNNVGPTKLFVCRWTKQPLTFLAQCCFVEAGNIGWLGGCGSGSCTHLCMFNNGGTCFDSDLVPHLNKYWEIFFSYASENSSGPIFSLHSNCHNYQRGSYFFKQYLTVLDFPLMHYFTCSWMKFVDFLDCLENFFHVCLLAFLSSQKLTLHL